ncbi:MAG: DNA replication and repair protein RecF [Chitinophagales bacterium]|nr:DNA replication and repair protein RecF [Chitinophagales bacterium]
MNDSFFIEQLKILNFKNYPELSIDFNANFICFVGENGVGKTNLLDAIYYLCTSKSYFNATEQYNFREGSEKISLITNIRKNESKYHIEINVEKRKRKEITINRVKEDSQIQYVGKFPVLMLAPDDNQIILGSSDKRRKMIDNILCQADIAYLENLVEYNKVLSNRNALLKQIFESGRRQDDLLDTIDTMLSALGTEIYRARQTFIDNFSIEFDKIYNHICDEKEKMSVVYTSHLQDDDVKRLLLQNREKDILLQRTTKGIHLDDLEFLLNDFPLKKIGSQGQQKTYIVSIKLALFSILTQYKKILPILLLDDIFDKFDGQRILRLFDILNQDFCGQVFISDTHRERVEDIMTKSVEKFEIFTVKNNGVQK